jgi:uncharacterized protein (DUF58 family)
MSTARTGQPMVRHYVDNRRPNLAVLLDGDAAAFHGDEFETGVEVTASLILSSMAARLPVSARVGRSWLLGRAKPGDHDAVLERCTVCAPDDSEVLVARVADTLRVEPGTSAIVIVTARRSTDELLAAVVHARRRARPIIVNVAADVDAVPPTLPGARLLRVRSLGEFRNAWDRTLA